jgi:RimJ/RimL family protein N-acetyltransferase
MGKARRTNDRPRAAETWSWGEWPIGGWECGSEGHLVLAEHLYLRPAAMHDHEALIATVDDEVIRWQGFPADKRRLRRQLKRSIERSLGNPYFEDWVICDLASGEIIGERTIAHVADRESTCETGSWLAGGWRVRGLGTEELRAVLQFTAEHLGYNTVEAGTESTNAAALRQYQKCGFVKYDSKPHRLPDKRVVESVWLKRVEDASIVGQPCPRLPWQG